MLVEGRTLSIDQRTITGSSNGSDTLAMGRSGGSFHIERQLGSGLGSNTIYASAGSLRAGAGHGAVRRVRKSYYLSV